MMTGDETAVLNALVEAFNRFVKLPDPHPSDHAEFAQGIHVLQRHVMARSTRREHRDLFPLSWPAA